MLMGKLVSRAQYKNYEYATAVLISVGMTAFLLGSGGDKKGRLYMQKIAKKIYKSIFCIVLLMRPFPFLTRCLSLRASMR